jgi:hypothetical protein
MRIMERERGRYGAIRQRVEVWVMAGWVVVRRDRRPMMTMDRRGGRSWMVRRGGKGVRKGQKGWDRGRRS